MFNASCQKRGGQRFWNKLVTIVALVTALGFFSTHPQSVHAAAPQPPQPPQFPSLDQKYGGHQPTAYHPTPTEQAYAADKGQLSQEYVQQVLTGNETLADYETHYRAFMAKWRLGNEANLHAALTRGSARLRSLSPSLAPTYAAQFPEEHYNWCGPATLSTTLVEDSFSWPNTNSYNGFTLDYDPYVTSQPYTKAYNDELWLAQNGVHRQRP